MRKSRKFTPEEQVSIVLEILLGEKSLAQASREYQIEESRLCRWKEQLLEGAKQSFTGGQRKRHMDKITGLERQVHKLTTQLEIAEKVSDYLRSQPPESES